MSSWMGDVLLIKVGIILYRRYCLLHSLLYAIRFLILQNNCRKEVDVSVLLIYDWECVYLQSTSLALFIDKTSFTCRLHDKKTNILNFSLESNQRMEVLRIKYQIYTSQLHNTHQIYFNSQLLKLDVLNKMEQTKIINTSTK